MPRLPAPTPGELFEWVFPTPEGGIGILAEVAIEGGTLILRGVAVYPATGAIRISVGTGMLVAAKNALAAEVAGMGFTGLRIVGRRISGAAPEKEIDLTIDLETKR